MAIDDILKAIPVDEVAQKLGVSPDVARQAIEEGGAALLGGIASNAQSAEGSAAIQKALGKHEGFGGKASVQDIDEADGEKIVKHVFGEKAGAVTESLNSSAKTAGGFDFGKLLPMLAPIVMGLIANGMKGKSAEPAAQESGGGGLGDVIGGLLGGGSGGSSGGGGGIGDILGGLLGGGTGSGGGGGGIDLGGIIGGLFGGKK